MDLNDVQINEDISVLKTMSKERVKKMVKKKNERVCFGHIVYGKI